MAYLLPQNAIVRIGLATGGQLAARQSGPTINTLLRRHHRLRPWRQYERCLELYPKLTKAVTGGVLGCVGDFIAQYIAFWQKPETTTHDEHSGTTRSSRQGPFDVRRRSFLRDGFDARRSFAFTAYNFAFSGVGLHYWINFLEAPHRNFSLLSKLALSHGAFYPVVYLPSFYAGFGLLNGQSVWEVKEKMQNELFGAWQQCAEVWVPANTFQFLFVPPHLQVTFIAGFRVVWCVILSSFANDRSNDHESGRNGGFVKCSTVVSPTDCSTAALGSAAPSLSTEKQEGMLVVRDGALQAPTGVLSPGNEKQAVNHGFVESKTCVHGQLGMEGMNSSDLEDASGNDAFSANRAGNAEWDTAAREAASAVLSNPSMFTLENYVVAREEFAMAKDARIALATHSNEQECHDDYENDEVGKKKL